jgi:hypothetical protein
VVVRLLPLLFNRVRQAITCLQHKLGLVLQAAVQFLEFGAAQRTGCRHHANASGVTQQCCRFDGRLYAKYRQCGKFLTQDMDSQSRGGIASNHQGFDLVLLQQGL